MFYDDETGEKIARQRNLRISITRGIIKYGYAVTDIFSIQTIKENFFFTERDLKYFLKKFFVIINEGYLLNKNEQEKIGRFIINHESATLKLTEAKIIFKKTFGRFAEEYQKHPGMLDHTRLNKIFEVNKPVIEILHWGMLPILNKWLMINSRRIPEDNLIDFYDHFDMMTALLKEINGEGDTMNTKSDLTLNKELKFSVYTRRHGFEDTYRIKRTVDGWRVDFISINGDCDKEGGEALYTNLSHDCVFFPEDGVRYAMKKLWEQADEGELSFEELQDRLQQIADWISHVEAAVGEAQPDWVGYY